MTYERPIDFVTKVGKIQIPFNLYAQGPIDSNDVVVKFRFDPRDITKEMYNGREELAIKVPKDVAELRNYIVSKKLKENDVSGKPKVMANGQQFGCYNVTPNNESDPERVEITLRPVFFFDHMGINQALDVPFFDGGKTSLRVKYKISGKDFEPYLPNAMGNSVCVVSSDNYLIFQNRGDKNAQYPNLLGIPAGFAKITDIEHGVISPRYIGARDAGEEANAGIKNPSDMVFMGIGRPWDDMHTEVAWKYFSKDTKADEMISGVHANSKYEGRLFKVPFGLGDETVRYLKDPSKWVLVHWLTIVQTLSNEFGEEKVIKKIRV